MQIPDALRPAFYKALAQDDASEALNTKGCATLKAQKLTACFGRDGARFSAPKAAALSLDLVAWGRGAKLAPVTAVAPKVTGERVSYAHGNLTEWWKVLPVGFEQGFTIVKRPAGAGTLTLALATNESATEAKGDLAWGKLRYGKLVVTDAKGHVIPATLKTEGKRVLIAVTDAHAAYPLTIDPLVWIEQKVTASAGAAGDQFGSSVAISGTTALIGAPQATVNGNIQQGVVYAFSDASGAWAQTAKLTSSDGAAGDSFGSAVALSGTTAVIGANDATVGSNGGQGAAYVFSDTSGTWTETAKLTASDGTASANFGYSVALSSTAALVGAFAATVGGNSGQGAAYIFSDAGGAWTQTAELTASDGAAGANFGYSVALSGTTALVGAYYATVNGNPGQGAAYVFSDAGGAWTQAAELTASDGAKNDTFGDSVALSGTTALVGAYFATVNGDSGQGAAYVFSDASGAWAQTAKLTSSDGAAGDSFGSAVALSGTTAVIGANDATVGSNRGQGAAYVFSDTSGAWTETAKLTASDGAASADFGGSVALSGSTALVGADNATVGGNASQGVAYFENGFNLGLAINAPQSVSHGAQYASDVILTNNAATATPPTTALILVPAATSFVSAVLADGTDGTCTPGTTNVSCALGPVAGNGGTAKVAVTFKATGDVEATIDNTASITGTTPALTASANTAITAAVPVVSLSPATLAFGSVNVGSAATQTVTLTNTGTAALTGLAFSFTGTNAADFAETSTCAATLPNTAGSNSCTITVSFKPTAAGSASATLAIASYAAGSPNIVPLTGTGDVPPVAQDESFSVPINTSWAGTLTATGTGTITYTIMDQPAHGIVQLLTASSGDFIYTPTAGYTGSDSFTFTASDGTATSEPATVTITVMASSSPSPPNPLTTPAPPAAHSHSGGGAFGIFGLLLLAPLVGWRKRRR